MKHTCKFCGAEQTNRGRLKHYGRYRGFECRTWIADGGQYQRSVKCQAREATLEILAGMGTPVAVASIKP